MSDCLHIYDSRTSCRYVVPIIDSVINSADLAAIRSSKIDDTASANGKKLRVLDPGFQNTAVKRSAITLADGEHGTLQFRGHHVEQLAHDNDLEDVAFLLIWGHFPRHEEKRGLTLKYAQECRNVPQVVVDVIRSFPDSTPFIPMIVAGLSAYMGAMSATIPAIAGGNLYHGRLKVVDESIVKVMAAYGSVLSLVHCHRNNQPWTEARDGQSYVSNLMIMMGLCVEPCGLPNPKYVRFLEKLWIMGADHDLANSTTALLTIASSLADPISCMIGALLSGYGPLHIGAAETGYRTMQRIGTPDKVAEAIADVKSGKIRLMGIGHRTYKTKDPRVIPVKTMLHELKMEGREDPLTEVAFEIERQVNADDFFKERRLCVNVDLFWMFAYTAMGIPLESIMPLFLAARTLGFLAHWREAMSQPIKLWRPEQVYIGHREPPTGNASQPRRSSL